MYPETITLNVENLDAVAGFYAYCVGLHILEKAEGSILLGVVDQPIVRLKRLTNGRLRIRNAPGLYHLALRVPTRVDLANWLRHYRELEMPNWQGASNHGVSEALYLADPEGNGIEITADKPREEWDFQADGRIVVYAERLDLRALSLLATDDPWGGLPQGSDLGHVHLQVGDIAAAKTFYVDLLGFDLKTELPDSALFIAHGDYHHHIGLNNWHSRNALSLPLAVYGMAEFSLRMEDQSAFIALRSRMDGKNNFVENGEHDFLVRDPSGNHIRIFLKNQSEEKKM